MGLTVNAHRKNLVAATGPGKSAPSEIARFGLVLLLLAAVLFGLLPLLVGTLPYWLRVFTNVCLLSFASLGVWLTFSIGRVNIAQGAFALIGGYAVGIMTVRFAVPFWLALPLAGLVAALIGTAIGVPLLRLRGIYFAMVTLAFTEATRLMFLTIPVLGSIEGVTSIPLPEVLGTPMRFYLFSAILLLAGYALVWRLQHSNIGRIFRAMRQNEELASSFGVDVARYRVLAFAICCFMGGVAGGMFAILQQNIYPTTYSVADSINFLLYCFLGGLDFVLGPIVGALVLVVSFELLRSIQDYQALLYGVLMIAVMLFLPNGLLSLPSAIARRLRRKK